MFFQDGLFIESKAAYQMQLVEDQPPEESGKEVPLHTQ